MKTIGVTLSEQVQAGLVVDYKLEAPLQFFPADAGEDGSLIELPTEGLVRTLSEEAYKMFGVHVVIRHFSGPNGATLYVSKSHCMPDKANTSALPPYCRLLVPQVAHVVHEVVGVPPP